MAITDREAILQQVNRVQLTQTPLPKWMNNHASVSSFLAHTKGATVIFPGPLKAPAVRLLTIRSGESVTYGRVSYHSSASAPALKHKPHFGTTKKNTLGRTVSFPTLLQQLQVKKLIFYLLYVLLPFL